MTNGNAAKKEPLITVLNKVRDAAQDILSLDVVTLTGTIQIKTVIKNKKINLQDLHTQITSDASINAGLKVVAFTHIDLDRDVTHFVDSGTGNALPGILENHKEMVRAADEARRAAITIVADLVGLGNA